MESSATALASQLRAISWQGPAHYRQRWSITQERLLHQLDHYITPRLQRMDGPLVVVIGGSTGAGKSTLINSIAGSVIVTAGVLRPTTTTATVLVHPSDEATLRRSRMLGARSQSSDASLTGGLTLTTTEAIPPGLVLIDTPDIDSIAQQHHEQALELLDVADQWLFVTTAARYADARWWEILDQALARQTAIALVVNRVPAGSEDNISQHLARMVQERYPHPVPIFTITEQALTAGMITSDQGQAITQWLHQLASDSASRQAVVRQTIAGMATSVGEQAMQLCDDVAQYNEQARRYRGQLAEIFDTQRFIQATSEGNLIRDEVLSQWSQSLGTSRWMHQLQRGFGNVRDRITGKSATQSAQVQEEVHSYVATVFTDLAQEYIEQAWQLAHHDPLLSTEQLPRYLQSVPEGFEPMVQEELSQWHHYLVSLVLEQGQSKRRTAQFAAGGVNAIAVALMLVAFATTGGLVGAEVAIAGGSAVVGQKLLEAVFGEDAVRKLAHDALEDLQSRSRRLLAILREPFEHLAPAIDVGDLRDHATDLMAQSAALKERKNS